jgi:hypothetical protein
MSSVLTQVNEHTTCAGEGEERSERDESESDMVCKGERQKGLHDCACKKEEEERRQQVAPSMLAV